MTLALALLISCSRIGDAAQLNAAITDVTFTADLDGSDQKYVMIVPAGFDHRKPHDVLIALHGHGSDRWQFINDPRDECRAARDVATAHDMIYVSPDYRASTSWMGPAAEADVVQIIRDLKRQYNVARVFITGGSMGGSACLTFAVLHAELIDGVASMNGMANFVAYENFLEAIAESFGGSKSDVPHEYKKRSAQLWPQKLTMPVGITASGQDTSVPPHSVLRLAAKLESLGRKVLLIHREQAGHETNYADATTILRFVIENAAPGSARK